MRHLSLTALFCFAFAAYVQACQNSFASQRIVDIGALPAGTGALLSEEIKLQPGEVILTFDDGPHPNVTPQILEILDRHCLKATFFALGRAVWRNQDLLRRTRAEGHTIGSHTFLHRRPTLTDLTPYIGDVDTGIQVIEDVLGETPVLFRPPFLRWPIEVAEVMAAKNLVVIGADVSGEDWAGRPCADSAGLIAEQLREKERGIILMHDIHQNTVCELEMVLAFLQDNHMTVVHLSGEPN